MSSVSTKRQWRFKFFTSSLVANVLDHYDSALYGLLAPFIAPLVFQDQDPVSRLILTYGLMSIGFITRPLGSWFFARLAYHRSAKEVFTSTLLGMALTTVGMGLLPTHVSIGIGSPILLALIRALQSFFAAGEATISPLLMLQYAEPKRLGFTGSLYQSSIVLGILLASVLASFVSYFPQYPDLWRLPFLLGSLTALAGWFIRYRCREFIENIPEPKASPSPNFWLNVRADKMKFLRVVMASSFTYLTYSVPFVLFNTFVPLVSTISLSEMLVLNTGLLVFDMFLVPVLGAMIDRANATQVMFYAALILGCLIIPFFMYLPSSTLIGITLVRIVIVVLGLIFLAPLQGWFYKQYAGPEKYMLIGLGYALGSEVFGRSLPSICLWLWHKTNFVIAPAIYLAFLCLVTAFLLKKKTRH